MQVIPDDSDESDHDSFVDSETGTDEIWSESNGLQDIRNCSHLAHSAGSSAASATSSIIAEALNALLTELFPDHKTWKREPIGSLIRLAEAFLKNRSDLADSVAALTRSTGVLFSIQLSEVITNMVGSESWHDSVTLAICLYTWLYHPKATKKDLVKAAFMDYLFATNDEVKLLIKASETGSTVFSSALSRLPDVGLRRLSMTHNRSGFLSCWKDLFQVVVNVLSYTPARHRSDEFHALLSKWKIGDSDPHHSLVGTPPNRVLSYKQGTEF